MVVVVIVVLLVVDFRYFFGRVQMGEFRQFGRIQTMRASSDRANSDILTPEEDLVHEQVYRLAFSQCFVSIGCVHRIACHGTVRFVGIFYFSALVSRLSALHFCDGGFADLLSLPE